MKYILFSFFILMTSVGNVMAAEEIAYKILDKADDIEIRQYEEVVAAELGVIATRRDAPGQAFRTLFNYIDGENLAAQNIPMTAPVSQAQNESGGWVIAFYMPHDMAYENTPKPKNDNITIRKIPAQKAASITFSGGATDSNIERHEKKLRAYLEANDISYLDKPIYAFYNSPMTPWFLRRNEVLFEILDSSPQ